MNDDDIIGSGEHGDLAAAEYVLGVLSAAERRAAELRIEREPHFAAEVAFWEARLAGLADQVAPVTPPAEVWRRIEAGLAAPGSTAAAGGILQSLAFWRAFAIGATAVAVASLAALVYVAELTGVGAPLLARLDQPSGQPEFLAAANPADGSVTVVPAALLTGQQQRSYELWVIPPGGSPHSLGLVDPERPVKVVVPPELLPHVSADSTLAITLEPPGGSPTGKPTGPVIANGKLASL
jgi:anti-sigma-K factor RskA